MCKIEIIKYGLLYCDLLYTLRIGVFDGFLSYKKTIVIMESTTEKRNISMLYWDEAKKGMMAGFIFSLFILLLFSFVSCDKDEDTSFEETPYYLGYFEGKVNSQDISIANQSNSHSFIDHGIGNNHRILLQGIPPCGKSHPYPVRHGHACITPKIQKT